MSLAIRALPKAVLGVCALCKTEQELSAWDSNLGGRICRECEPFLDAAETALVAAKCGHPYDIPLSSLTRNAFGLDSRSIRI